MNIIKIIINEIWGFFSLDGLLTIIKNGNYAALLTYDGFTSIIAPLLPLILILELIRGILYKKFSIVNYKIPFFSYLLNAVLGRYLSLGMTMVCIGFFERYALINISFTWYWLIYGYIIWEFAHFVYHFLAHKVRLFWCLHATHHAPESMNLSISYAHFFLEAPYADIIRTSICILAGVPPPMLFVIMFIDGTWGSFIHIGETILPDARLGFLGKFILTPSHHRVHHAKNIEYMDTNFCNLLNIWDKVFQTYTTENIQTSIQYGITREHPKNHFLDAYFGEFMYLAKDVYQAPGIKNKVMYLLMPPGWNHLGDHTTANAMKKKLSNPSISYN
jgi:sterol desaturase/sphingolipid hydroxylase (fatty acid hydroxylase superfamily)